MHKLAETGSNAMLGGNRVKITTLVTPIATLRSSALGITHDELSGINANQAVLPLSRTKIFGLGHDVNRVLHGDASILSRYKKLQELFLNSL